MQSTSLQERIVSAKRHLHKIADAIRSYNALFFLTN